MSITTCISSSTSRKYCAFALKLACVFTGMIYILLVKLKSFEIILLHIKSISTPNINIAPLYTAILLADVLTASDMRMREKLHHKGNPKNLLYHHRELNFFFFCSTLKVRIINKYYLNREGGGRGRGGRVALPP